MGNQKCQELQSFLRYADSIESIKVNCLISKVLHIFCFLNRYFLFLLSNKKVEVYISLLVLTTLMQQGPTVSKQCADASTALFNTVQSLNRRSLDLLRAKVFHYFSLAHERHLGNIATLRPTLLEAHRLACIQHDEMGQATLLNLLLRSLLEENQVTCFCYRVPCMLSMFAFLLLELTPPSKTASKICYGLYVTD